MYFYFYFYFYTFLSYLFGLAQLRSIGLLCVPISASSEPENLIFSIRALNGFGDRPIFLVGLYGVAMGSLRWKNSLPTTSKRATYARQKRDLSTTQKYQIIFEQKSVLRLIGLFFYYSTTFFVRH